MESDKMHPILKFLARPSILVTLAVGMIIAVLVPEHWACQYEMVRKYIEFMSTIIPSIDGYRTKSAFPCISSLYFSVMFPLGIIWMVEGFMAPIEVMTDHESILYRSIIERRCSRYPTILFCALFCIGGFVLLMVQPGYDFNVTQINSNRIALGIFGPLFTMLPFFALVLPVKAILLNAKISASR